MLLSLYYYKLSYDLGNYVDCLCFSVEIMKACRFMCQICHANAQQCSDGVMSSCHCMGGKYESGFFYVGPPKQDNFLDPYMVYILVINTHSTN